MTYRDDTESVRAENERLRAEVESLRAKAGPVLAQERTLEMWERYAMPVICFGVPIMGAACIAAFCVPIVGAVFPVVVGFWWSWAAWRCSLP